MDEDEWEDDLDDVVFDLPRNVVRSGRVKWDDDENVWVKLPRSYAQQVVNMNSSKLLRQDTLVKACEDALHEHDDEWPDPKPGVPTVNLLEPEETPWWHTLTRGFRK